MARITRATTPHINFELTTDYSAANKILLTFSQMGRQVLNFNKEDMTFSSHTVGTTTIYVISVVMTQEQANLFEANSKASVMFRFKVGNDVIPSTEATIDVKEALNDEVM